MIRIARTLEVAQSADTVWSTCGALDAIATWHPAIAKATALEGNKGRVCVLADGPEIKETVESFDPANRTYTYLITEGPLPVKNYRATFSVTPNQNGGTTISWNGEFEALGDAAEVEAMMAGVYDAGMAGIEATLGAKG